MEMKKTKTEKVFCFACFIVLSSLLPFAICVPSSSRCLCCGCISFSSELIFFFIIQKWQRLYKTKLYFLKKNFVGWFIAMHEHLLIRGAFDWHVHKETFFLVRFWYESESKRKKKRIWHAEHGSCIWDFHGFFYTDTIHFFMISILGFEFISFARTQYVSSSNRK